MSNATAIFNAVDKDASGFVDRDELKAHVTAHLISQGVLLTPAACEDMANQLFAKLDADADGRITVDEWVRVYAAARQQVQEGRGDQPV